MTIDDFAYFLWKCNDIGFEEALLEHTSCLPSHPEIEYAVRSIKATYKIAWDRIAKLAKEWELEEVLNDVECHP